MSRKELFPTDTILGWTASVAAHTVHRVILRNESLRYEINFFDNQSTTFDRFWEIEDILSSPESRNSCNKLECIQRFDQTTTYGSDTDERAKVRLPIESQGTYDEITNEWWSDFGQSARKAFRQFICNEKQLRQNREAKNQYNVFVQKTIDTGNIEKVPVSDQFLSVGKYLIMPHQAV